MISAAFYATALPPPIAIPMSAFLIAGESLTPSPVTATIWPDLWQASTIRSFYEGVVLANTTSALLTQSIKNLPFSGSASSSSYSAAYFSASKSP
jgi:hypothetical protein